jgi:hypothetical protein
MDLENTQDTTESVTPAASTPVTEAAPASRLELTDDPAPVVAATPSVEAPAPAPAYSPDFKYKVFGETRELDPKVREFIKDKESEEYFKSVFSKADGIEGMKEQREHYRSQYNNLAQEAQKVIAAVDSGNYGEALSQLGVDTKNIGQVMQGLGFRKEDVIKYAYGLAQLTPEQEQAYARQRELEQYARQKDQSVSEAEQKLMQADVKLRTFELKSVLSTPEYASLVSTFDQSQGQGAFWNHVCERGDYYFRRGVDKPVHEVVEEVAKTFKAFMPQSQPQQGAPAQVVKPSANVPVIPTVGSGGASPARRKVQTLADMKAFAANLED